MSIIPFNHVDREGAITGKFTCKCGCIFSHQHVMEKHLLSSKHHQLMEGTYKPITGMASPNYGRGRNVTVTGKPNNLLTWLGRSNDKEYPKEEKEPCECGAMVGVSNWSKKQHQQTAVHTRMMMDVIERKYTGKGQGTWFRHKTESEAYETQKARQVVKVTCDCGCEVSRGNLATHKRSARHSHMMAELFTEKHKKMRSYFVPSLGYWRRIAPGGDWMKDPDLKGKMGVQVSRKHNGLECWIPANSYVCAWGEPWVGKVVPTWPGIKEGRDFWSYKTQTYQKFLLQGINAYEDDDDDD
jgi:hypothetical protein